MFCKFKVYSIIQCMYILQTFPNNVSEHIILHMITILMFCGCFVLLSTVPFKYTGDTVLLTIVTLLYM